MKTLGVTIDVEPALSDSGLIMGVVEGQGVNLRASSSGLRDLLTSLIADRCEIDFPEPQLKAAVRDLLRQGGYKPSGRGKPASEYLAQAAKEGRFPFINNLVDINNYISLLSGLPCSLLDLEIIGRQIFVRWGLPGEKYVFNESGQEIDLTGLICLCRKDGTASTPLGNPVKDSMQAKVSQRTKSVVGVIFAPQGVIDTSCLFQYAEQFAEMLKKFADAEKTEVQVI